MFSAEDYPVLAGMSWVIWCFIWLHPLGRARDCSDHLSKPHQGSMADSFLSSQRLARLSEMPHTRRPTYLCECQYSQSSSCSRHLFSCFYFGGTISVSCLWLTQVIGFRESLFYYFLIYEIVRVCKCKRNWLFVDLTKKSLEILIIK